ncbi:hypothetical protein K435DRAFT_773368 [Dendrothele bispora CBS 962.96]|uniref:Uncharacterized protein n=1 Tax=Dendrothele bispora (strain CBS 962.96) TaxID=1314807 RepID=A0A4S8MTC5_DENBC|nr:hypothetical protein K435DRAFT_773368 [Dendrothele bispora CBS 962.96]
MSNSAAQLLGILCLINGHKTTISGRPYAEYTTAIATLDGRSPAAVVRIWQKPGASLLVNNTCVLTLAKISVTRDDTPWVIEPIIIHPFPGDPNDDQYDNALPDFPVPVMILTGTVLSATTNAIAPYNAPTKAFVVATSEFVCGSVVTYSLRACFDPSSPKWTKVPVPNVGNNIFVVGHFRGVYNNTLHLDVESIVLNMGISSNNGSLATPINSPDDNGKKRKFSAIATMNSTSTDEIEPKSPAVKKIRFEMPPPMVIATETANGTLEGDAVIVNDETTAAPDPVVPLRIVDESQVVSAKVRGKRAEKK